jgi:hypothetical protein
MYPTQLDVDVIFLLLVSAIMVGHPVVFLYLFLLIS